MARQRLVAPLTELRVPFQVARAAVDDVDRGSQDSDWQPVKDAARLIAFAEDRAIFEGYPAAQIPGIRAASSNPAMTLPADVLSYPEAIAEALRYLREAGVNGPYSVLLSADAYTAVSETRDHGYPVHEHIKRQITGEIVWAPAIEGAFVLTTRGGDFALYLGQDISIGYLSHDADSVRAVPAGVADRAGFHQRGRGRAGRVAPRPDLGIPGQLAHFARFAGLSLLTLLACL